MTCNFCSNDQNGRAKYCAQCGRSLVTIVSTSSSVVDEHNPEAKVAKLSLAPIDAVGHDTPETSSTEPASPDGNLSSGDSSSAAVVDADVAKTPQAEDPTTTDPVLEQDDVSVSEPEETSQEETAAGEVSIEHGGEETPSPSNAELSPDTILQGRFRIRRTLKNGDGKIRYDAEDLQRCGSCEGAIAEQDHRFCEQCGVEIDAKLSVTLREMDVQEDPTDTMNVLTEGGHRYCVEASTPSVTETETPVRGLQLLVGHQSDTGQAREIDEDSVLVLNLAGLSETKSNPLVGLFAIADGIGGHQDGEVASRTALRLLASDVMEVIFLPALRQEVQPAIKHLKLRLEASVKAANLEIRTIQKTWGTDTGCTLTAALVRDDTAIIANVGDSRAYLMRNGKLKQISKDHSEVVRQVEQGLIEPEEASTSGLQGMIYRSLGGKPEVDVDLFERTLEPEDRLLLCSDGLSDMLSDHDIETTLLDGHDVQATCEQLIDFANTAGGDDNISVVLIDVRPLADWSARTESENVRV